MIREIRRTEQPEFFAGERHEKNRAFPFVLVSCGKPCDLQHSGRAGCIVVGPVMDLSDLRWCEGVLIAQPEVIIVRTDNDPFVLQHRIGSGHSRDNILYGFPRPDNVR